MCKSLSAPIFGLYLEHLSVVFRGIGFMRSQTRRNYTTSTIAEANIDVTRSIFVRSRQRSTTYRLERFSNVALFPCGVNSSRLYFLVFSWLSYLLPKTAIEILRKYKQRKGEDSAGRVYFHWFCAFVFPNSNLISSQRPIFNSYKFIRSLS